MNRRDILERLEKRRDLNERLERLLGLESLWVSDASLEPEGLVVRVVACPVEPRCATCNDSRSWYGRHPVRRWRHVTLERTPVWLTHAPRRTNCYLHGVRVQPVPWAARRVRFTTEFEQMVHWLCRRVGVPATCRLMRIPWGTAERLQSLCVLSLPALKRIEERYVIGEDALSLRNHAQDLTAVLEHLGRPMPPVITLPSLPASAC